MPLAPETAVSPVAQAPPDRPTANLEQWARQGIALLFGDRVLDMDERRILRAFFEEVQLRAMNGGMGNGATPPPGMEGAQPGASPMDMNQNTQDMGTAEGAAPEDDTGGY